MTDENKEQPENTTEQPIAQENPESHPKAQASDQKSEPASELEPQDDEGPSSDRYDNGDTQEEESVVHTVLESSEFVEKVVAINRITKVTKGGKRLSFSALVVVGDTKGNVGYSLSKAAEVSIAIRKAIVTAKKNMVRIPLKGTTIPHEIIGQCSGSRVLLKPASEGTGVIASGPVRAVCDGVGIHNILTKCHRSNNPINVVKATMDGLVRLKFSDEAGIKG
jgi:small subunit ribosomal protein S5